MVEIPLDWHKSSIQLTKLSIEERICNLINYYLHVMYIKIQISFLLLNLVVLDVVEFLFGFELKSAC